MTVIAYKDRTLAGDSAWSDRGTITSLQSKLTRLPSGVLYGASGEGDDRDLLALLEAVKTPDDLPSMDNLKRLSCSVIALLVFPDGSVFTVETGKKNGCAERTTEPCAVGSGRDLAIGAMLAGKSAAEACSIAASRDIYCREPITTLSLDEGNRKKT